MVRAAVGYLILFIAAVSVSTLFVGTLVTEAGLYAQSLEGEADDVTRTSIVSRIELTQE